MRLRVDHAFQDDLGMGGNADAVFRRAHHLQGFAHQTAGDVAPIQESMMDGSSRGYARNDSILRPLSESIAGGRRALAVNDSIHGLPIVGALIYITRATARIIDDLVVNMIDVGEETGELDKMLYKVADNYDEEVDVLTESLVSLLEPLLIIVLGVIVGFIVIALFLPLVALIQKLS